MGRPSKYSSKLADEICVRLVSGESLRKICSGKTMPGMTSIFKWLRETPEFAKQYAYAREAQAEALADEIISISDDRSNDTIDGEYGEVPNAAAIQRDRLRVDSRKWYASKLLPRKYGDKLDVTHSEGLPTMRVELVGVENE